jgi:hypothetical protein
VHPALIALWVALGLFVLAAGGATAVLVLRGLRFWRDLKRFMRILGAASDLLGARADEAAGKAGGAGSGTGRLAASTARLSRSLAYARVVADAAGDSWATVTRLRGSVPRK